MRKHETENNIELLERIKLLKRVNAKLEGMETMRLEETEKQEEDEEKEDITITVEEKEDERKEEDEKDRERGKKEVIDEKEKRDMEIATMRSMKEGKPE